MTLSRFRSRRKLENHQLEKLSRLLHSVAESNRFYSDKLYVANAPLAAVSWQYFRESIPWTTKDEIVADQESHPPYGTNLTYPVQRYIRLSQTSATSGSPLRWLDTDESWDWMLGCWRSILEISRVTSEDRVFFAFSFGPFLGFWTAFEAAARMGCLCIPGGGLGSMARLKMILDNRATVLFCTPTYALRLAEVATENGIDLARSEIRRIVVAGEPGGCIPGVRKRIEERWPGARVVDHHGMTEIGPASYQCPKVRDRLHVLESEFIAEIIDPYAGCPAESGGKGELVLTNLGRVGSPLIRYRTGDMVETTASPVCECGSVDLALEGGILARLDDMVIVRGVNLYPGAVEQVIRTCDGVEEFRVEVNMQRALPQVSIQVEPVRDCNDGEALRVRLEQALRVAFALRIPVSLVPAGSLPRFEMKGRRWIRL